MLSDTAQWSRGPEQRVQQPAVGNSPQLGLGPGEEIEILAVVSHKVDQHGKMLFLVVSKESRTYLLNYLTAAQIYPVQVCKYCSDKKGSFYLNCL